MIAVSAKLDFNIFEIFLLKNSQVMRNLFEQDREFWANDNTYEENCNTKKLNKPREKYEIPKWNFQKIPSCMCYVSQYLRQINDSTQILM